MHQTKLSVAPMVAVTTPYHRFVCRLLSRHVTLYTEMVVAESLVFGKPSIVDGFLDAGASGPVVLQLAGRDSNHLCQAIQLAQKRGGFSSININCGCPSKKAAVGGAFGAQMMKEPELLNSIVLDILKVSSLPVTIKMRLGVDEFDSYEYVASFVLKLINSGVTHFIVHARKGILGLDTKKNRSVPPLKYEWVYRLCSDFPDASFEINGGINSLEEARAIWKACDKINGFMLGRAVWRDPLLLCEADELWFLDDDDESRPRTRREVLTQYVDHFETSPYVLAEALEALSGIFCGVAGASAFRTGVHQLRSSGCKSLKEIVFHAMTLVPSSSLDADIRLERKKLADFLEVGMAPSPALLPL